MLVQKHEFCCADVTKCYFGADLLEYLGAIIDFENKCLTTNVGVCITLTSNSSDAHCKFVPFHVSSEINFIDDVMFLTDDLIDVPCDSDVTCGNSNKSTRVTELIESYSGFFSGIGKTDLDQHYIPNTDNVPINLLSYRLPVHLKDKAKKIIQEY
ncbi:hypothetical protein GQR58_006223 [Nymphon striatum]|nr:hypothetical protein GQR58_006223 [Nymphon striatum]